MASPTGESSNQENSNCQLESLDEEILERLFETFHEWSVELGRVANDGRSMI
jgi:hypothetical protein